MSSPDILLLLSDARGIYIPRDFMQGFAHSISNPDSVKESLADLESPDNEFYWDSWDTVLNNAHIKDKAGNEYFLHQDGDLWAIPMGWEWDEDDNKWAPPTPVDCTVYTLPASWACALINGDESGLEESELAELNAWLETEKPGACLTCSEHTILTRHHDAHNSLLTECLKYTFKDERPMPGKLYWASFERFELRIPGDCVVDCSHSGDCSEDVRAWADKVRAQSEKDAFPRPPTAELIRAELKEYGAWDDSELEDESVNWGRIVWLASCDINEDEDRDCSEPCKP